MVLRFHGEHSLQELHRFVRDSKGQRRRSKAPCDAGLGGSFEIEREEWYTYDKSPRPNVHVLASVDEKTYMPDSPLKMGDHPVVWSNEHVKARNVYIFMGHRPEHFQNQAFTTLFRNSIFWAANP